MSAPACTVLRELTPAERLAWPKAAAIYCNLPAVRSGPIVYPSRWTGSYVATQSACALHEGHWGDRLPRLPEVTRG